MDLYSNLHPNRTMKGTGFKDKKTAIETIKIIRYRSPTYQLNVIIQCLTALNITRTKPLKCVMQ